MPLLQGAYLVGTLAMAALCRTAAVLYGVSSLASRPVQVVVPASMCMHV